MEQAFQAVADRAHALRLTENEVVEAAGINRVRYWRAKTGVTKPNGAVKLLRIVEAKLTELEASARPTCALCNKTTNEGCLTFGCPMTKTEAA